MYNKYTVRKRGFGPDALRRFGKDEHRKLAVPKDQVTAHREADNYFVIISRKTLSQLPYSKDELYGLQEEADSGRDHLPGRVYNEMYRLFGKDENLAGVPEKG